MEAADQLGMFADPEGEPVCTCGHNQSLHTHKGKGDCTYLDCTCSRFQGSGAIAPKAKAEPRARATDPLTSHAAAKSIRDPTKNQIAVLHVLHSCGPVTDEVLVPAYEEAVRRRMMMVRDVPVPQQSQSGIRTRRKELADAGMVLEHDTVRGGTGRQMVRWKVNSADKRVAKILQVRLESRI